MRYISKGVFLLCLLFSYKGLHADTSFVSESQKKMYFDTHQIMIENKAIYIHLAEDWVETNILRSDEKGFYLFEEDVKRFGSRVSSSKWKCPYCSLWWEFGEPCQNEKCPKNQWKKNKEERS